MKKRSEIEEKYKWDLTTIYKNEDDFKSDLAKAKKEIYKVTCYKDKFLKSSKDFLEFMTYDEKIDRLTSKLYYYAHLNYDSDTSSDKYKKMLNEVRDICIKYSELSSFVVPDMLKADYSLYEKFFEELNRVSDVKVRNLPPHCCRHTFSSRCEWSGVPMTVTKELLGHTSVSMTNKYTHIMNDEKEAAISKFS